MPHANKQKVPDTGRSKRKLGPAKPPAAIIAAVQPNLDGHPQLHVSSFTLAEILPYANLAIAPGSQMFRDRLGCSRAFDTPPYTHARIITGSGLASNPVPAFRWVKTALGNAKKRETGNGGIPQNDGHKYFAFDLASEEPNELASKKAWPMVMRVDGSPPFTADEPLDSEAPPQMAYPPVRRAAVRGPIRCARGDTSRTEAATRQRKATTGKGIAQNT